MGWLSPKQYAIAQQLEGGKELIAKLPDLTDEESQDEFGRLLNKGNYLPGSPMSESIKTKPIEDKELIKDRVKSRINQYKGFDWDSKRTWEMKPEHRDAVADILSDIDSDQSELCLKVMEKVRIQVNTLEEDKDAGYYQSSRGKISIRPEDLGREAFDIYEKDEVLLHELGHAIDDRIMIYSKDENGNWHGVTTASLNYVSKKHKTTMNKMLLKERKEVFGSYVWKSVYDRNYNWDENGNKTWIESSFDRENWMLDDKGKEFKKRWLKDLDNYEKDACRELDEKIANTQDVDERLKARWERMKVYNKAKDEFLRQNSFLADAYCIAHHADDSLGVYHDREHTDVKGAGSSELFAEAFSAKARGSKSYQLMKHYFPKTMEIFEEILEGYKNIPLDL